MFSGLLRRDIGLDIYQESLYFGRIRCGFHPVRLPGGKGVGQLHDDRRRPGA
jgi:hypothetical protein